MSETDGWIIAKGWGDFELMQVTKQTSKQVKAIDGYKRPRTIPINEVIAATGDEAKARSLLDRLVSSSALAKQQAAEAHTRHRDRVQKLVAEFSALPNPRSLTDD